jgi:hypothetical protein
MRRGSARGFAFEWIRSGYLFEAFLLAILFLLLAADTAFSYLSTLYYGIAVSVTRYLNVLEPAWSG